MTEDREAQRRAILAKSRKVKVTTANVVDFVIKYETGQMDAPTTLAFFRFLVKTGMAWTLQGSYGRAAQSLIDAGWISRPKR